MTKTLFGLPVRDIPHRDKIMRALQKYVVVGEGCWEWTAAVNAKDYGKFGFQTNTKPYFFLAHRAAYLLFVEDIHEGHLVCHKCDNPQCVRPDHLFTGTHSDNMQDCANKGRNVWQNRKPSLAHRKNNSTKHYALWRDSEYRKRQIESRQRSGISLETAKSIMDDQRPYSQLARIYGVSIGSISRIKNRKTWHFRDD